MLKLKKIIVVLAIGLVFGVSANSLADEVRMPTGMKNVVYTSYIGVWNAGGLIRAAWSYVDDNNRSCTNVQYSNCHKYDWARGDYNVVYSNPHDLTQCYLELGAYIQANYPDDLNITKVYDKIKAVALNDGINVDSTDTSNDTLTQHIYIISTDNN